MPKSLPARVLVVLVALAPTAAHATLVVVDYTGVVTSSDYSRQPGKAVAELPDFRVGDTLSGAFSFDPATAFSPGPAGLRYGLAGGSTWVPAIRPASLGVTDSAPGAGPDDLRFVFESGFAFAIYTLSDPTGTALSVATPPTTLDPARFTTFTLTVNLEANGEGSEFRAALAAVPAPEPATLGMAALGMGLLAAAAWRRPGLRLAHGSAQVTAAAASPSTAAGPVARAVAVVATALGSSAVAL